MEKEEIWRPKKTTKNPEMLKLTFSKSMGNQQCRELLLSSTGASVDAGGMTTVAEKSS